MSSTAGGPARPEAGGAPASTSGWLITSIASPEKASSLNLLAAASALETVGLEIITAFAFSHFESASKCTMPIRPAPMMPTPRMPLSASFMFTLLTCPSRREVRDVTQVSSAAQPTSKNRQRAAARSRIWLCATCRLFVRCAGA